MVATGTPNVDPVKQNSTSHLADHIAEDYYKTTAIRGHDPTVEYYKNCSEGLLRSIGPWLPNNKDFRCLDLACGCGEFLYLLESKGFRYTSGVDLCDEELQHASRYVNSNLTKADVLEYLKTTESQRYDFVTALNLLEHLKKDELLAVLKECRRVLKPGGTLVAMVPNAVSPFGSVTRYWDITHEGSFTTNNFQQLAALAGFSTNIDVRECGPRVHGVVSGLRYIVWQMLRALIAAWFLIEVGTVRGGIYTMDMLVRLRVPK